METFGFGIDKFSSQSAASNFFIAEISCTKGDLPADPQKTTASNVSEHRPLLTPNEWGHDSILSTHSLA